MTLMIAVRVAFMLALLVAVVAAASFWVWTLHDCLAREPQDAPADAPGRERLIWWPIVAFLGVLGALAYCVVRRPQRIREHGR